MDIEALLLVVLSSLLGASIPLLVMYRLRVRILRSTIKFAAKHAPDEFQDLALGTIMTWEEKKDESGKIVRYYSPKPLLVNFIASVMPVVVSIGWQSFRKVLPGAGNALMVGPDGKPALNMLAPIAIKLAEGKKIKMDDFLPAVMEKALPFIEQLAGSLGGMFGGAGGAKAPNAPGAPPKPPSGGGGFNPG